MVSNWSNVSADPVTFLKVIAMVFYMSILTIIVISVFAGFGTGLFSFPTAISSFASLYSPTVVIYGVKLLPVTLLFNLPSLILAEVEKIFPSLSYTVFNELVSADGL